MRSATKKGGKEGAPRRVVKSDLSRSATCSEQCTLGEVMDLRQNRRSEEGREKKGEDKGGVVECPRPERSD